MIVTGESSGELYGSLLASEIRKKWPDVELLGVGGERMKKAGVKVFSGIAGAFGLTEALSAYREVRRTFKETVRMLKTASPELVVLIDYPDFNFRVGKEARAMGIRVLYYVSPQVWAWRGGRVRTMASFVDRMAVILPFEEQLYREAGVPCEFVGHPILDEMERMPSDMHEAGELLGLERDKPYLAVLPGSRRGELTRHLPLLLDVVRQFKREFPDYGFLLPLSENIEEGEHREHLDNLALEGVKIIKGNAVLAYTASEVAVVASGTAALQAVFRGVPLVVIYKASPLTFWVARLLVSVKYVNIANLIMDRPIVPELLQGRANAREIMGALRPLVSGEAGRERMVAAFGEVRKFFDGKSPSRRVAEMAGELAGWV
jgi:lipid-A-disaccharide synthase